MFQVRLVWSQAEGLYFQTGSRGGNGRAQFTTSAAPASCPTQQGNSSCICGGQRKNRLYALQSRKDKEGSPNLVTSMLQVFDLNVYALLNPGVTLSFVTPYIAVQFSVSLETLSESLSVSTQVGEPIITRRVYRNFPITVSQKVSSADIIEL